MPLQGLKRPLPLKLHWPTFYIGVIMEEKEEKRINTAHICVFLYWLILSTNKVIKKLIKINDKIIYIEETKN